MTPQVLQKLQAARGAIPAPMAPAQRVVSPAPIGRATRMPVAGVPA